jgi:hypothetical protein
MQCSWEGGRSVAALAVKPTDQILFPREEKDNGDGAAITKGTCSEEGEGVGRKDETLRD